MRWQHQKGADIGHGQSIQAGQFPTWPPVSQIPPCHWWEVPPCCCKDGSSRRYRVWMGYKGASKLPARKASLAPTGKGGCWKLLTEKGQIQIGTPLLVKHLVVDIAGGGGRMRNALPLHVWTCQFSNLWIQTRM